MDVYETYSIPGSIIDGHTAAAAAAAA